MSEFIKISEQLVGVASGDVYVKKHTPQNLVAPPVILLHDSLGCTEMWRDFPQNLALSTQREVISYDRLGFGKSSARKSLPSIRFVSEEAETILPTLLDALSVQTFSFFGHSVGGAMAVVAAGVFRDRCENVITESAQAFVEERTREGILKAKADFSNPQVFEKLKKYHGDKTQWVLDAWIKVWLSNEFSDWTLKNDLPKMRCPALIIHGDKDEYGSKAFPDMISNLAGGISKKEIVENCGHVPHREKPQDILNLVSDFLKSAPLRPAKS